MGRKILLVVDLQKDFIDGSLAVKDAANVIPAINEVKNKFDWVYFTLDWHPTNHCSFKEQGGPWPVHCVHYTAGTALPESVLEGLKESRMRFIRKGCKPGKEEYGAFEGVKASDQDYFREGDVVTVCGIASEYCVLTTLKNVFKLSKKVGFKVNVFLEGTAKFESYDTLLAFMQENNIKKKTF